MLIDLREAAIAEAFPLEADVCIVGAGAAGIALARKLVGTGHRIVLLESGGADYEPAAAALNAGSNEGFPYYDLEDARLRLFGGTAAIWGGRCAELDDIDFEPREWVRYSGWPFAKAVLAPYYAQARKLLELDTRHLDERLWHDLRVPPPAFGTGVLGVDFWQFDDHWDRFGFAANQALRAHPDLTVVLHATATSLELNGSGTAVDRVTIAGPGGERGVIRAGMFVLCAGGIENPRLLLTSRARHTNGIGNEHDVVGRFFMEHPHANGGRLELRALWQGLRTFRSSHWLDGGRYAACLRLDDDLQREHGVLNTSVTPRVRPHGTSLSVVRHLYQSMREHAPPTSGIRKLWRLYRATKRRCKTLLHPLQPWLGIKSGSKGLYLSVRAEQAPNPQSRIRLNGERDALGMLRVALNWRLSELDKRSVTTMVATLDRQMLREGSGRVTPASWLSEPGTIWESNATISLHAIGGYHHMGTTRMATDPRFGVVDMQCRVHGLANLFVGGSSVFPTSGWANPTLTILALSLRLGDHLLALLERPARVVRTRDADQTMPAAVLG